MSTINKQTRPDFFIKEGSERPVFTDQLRHARPNDGVVDLEDATEVRFYLQHVKTDELIVNAAAEIVDREEGLVQYSWGPGDAIVTGPHDAEWRVEFEDGSTYWYPENRNLRVTVTGGISGRELDPGDIADEDLEVRALSTDVLRANTSTSISVESTLDHNGNNLTDIGSIGAQSGLINDLDVSTLDFDQWDVTEVNDADTTGPTLRFTHETDGRQFEIGTGGVKAFEEPVDPEDVVRQQELDEFDPGAWEPVEWDIVDVSEHGFPGDESGGDLFTFIRNNGPAHYVLPEGRYSVESELDFMTELDTWTRFTIEGKGNGATLVVNNNDEVDTLMRTYDSSSNLDYVRLENFDVEIDYGTQTGRDDPPNFDGVDAGVARISVNKRLVMRDIELVGRRAFHSLKDWYEQDTANRTDYSGEIYNQRVNILEKDGTAVIENVRYPDGGEGSDRPRVIPISVEGDNVGIQIYKNCHVYGWQGNSYYIKDGPGTSLLFGCTAGNGGAQMFRYGQQDLSIAGQTWTDDDLENLDHTAGTHLDVHLGEGTGVFGHRCEDTRGTSELVRARSGNKQATIRDLYIYTTGTNACIRTSSSSSGDNNVAEHGDGHLVFDNVRIEVESADTSAAKLGAIENRRSNTVYRNVSTWIDAPNTGYTSINLQRGDAAFENCKFGMSDTNSAGYVAIVGPNDSTDARPGRFEFTGCNFEGQVYTYAGDQIDVLSFVGCDFTGVSSVWGRDDPTTIDSIGNLTIFRNPGLDTQIVNNDPVVVQTSAWDGSSMTLQAGDDTIDFLG